MAFTSLLISPKSQLVSSPIPCSKSNLSSFSPNIISMESMAISAAIPSSSPCPLSTFFPKKSLSRRPLLLPISSKNKEDGSDLHSAPDDDSTHLVPFFKNPSSISPLSKDAAMGLVLSAVAGRGWTIGSGMEGPSAPAASNDRRAVSTFPWSLFTKSPRRRMRVAFTCNICGQRTTRAINPHAYTDGTVFVQCCGCNVFHKLVDNLNLFHEMKCYVNPSFRYQGDVSFNYLDEDDDNEGNIFPIL